MSELSAQFERVAHELAPLCEHISVRDDAGVPFIFAIGLKGVHTLEMRAGDDGYIVELWEGPADDERVVGEPSFTELAAAVSEAKSWLSRDAI